jgi:hypothetical protein
MGMRRCGIVSPASLVSRRGTRGRWFAPRHISFRCAFAFGAVVLARTLGTLTLAITTDDGAGAAAVRRFALVEERIARSVPLTLLPSFAFAARLMVGESMQ